MRTENQWSSRTTWTLLPLFGGLYAAQGVTGSMVQTALPTVLRDRGMPLDQLGLLYVLFLPWALKFLWAPLVDRYFWPRIGARRSWLLPCQFALALCFLGASWLPPDTHFTALLVMLLVIALFASTQDIATDALAADASNDQTRGLVSGAGVFGGYFGFLIGVGIWLPVYAAFGWAASMLTMAAAVVLLTIPTLLARNLDCNTPPPSQATSRPSVIAGLKRRTLRRGLCFMVLYQIGVRLGVSLLGPFLVDTGLSLTTIGWLKGTGGTVAGLAGAALGAWLVRRFDTFRCMIGFALLDALVYLGFAGASLTRTHDVTVLAGLVLALSVCTALTFVALYAAMMGWCSPTQTGTDFAILQSADALLAIVLAAAAGSIGQAFGHATNFTVSAICLVFAAAVATRLTWLADVPTPASSSSDLASSSSSDLRLTDHTP